MKNSGLVRKEVTYYMFGFYAIKCWDSENFWFSDPLVDRNDPYWKVFRDFVKEAKDYDCNKVKAIKEQIQI